MVLRFQYQKLGNHVKKLYQNRLAQPLETQVELFHQHFRTYLGNKQLYGHPRIRWIRDHL